MERRDFLKKVVAAGALASSAGLLPNGLIPVAHASDNDEIAEGNRRYAHPYESGRSAQAAE